GLKLSPEKYFFFEQELSFLGYIISKEGIQTDPNKIAIMRNFPVPKDLTQLRKFIALISYYRRFIKGFANIIEPLNRLFKKNTPFI
ncbi:9144_t:CDS:1, partial [Funneliformis caledonium]